MTVRIYVWSPPQKCVPVTVLALIALHSAITDDNLLNWVEPEMLKIGYKVEFYEIYEIVPVCLLFLITSQ